MAADQARAVVAETKRIRGWESRAGHRDDPSDSTAVAMARA
jgi:hypothetical protein